MTARFSGALLNGVRVNATTFRRRAWTGRLIVTGPHHAWAWTGDDRPLAVMLGREPRIHPTAREEWRTGATKKCVVKSSLLSSPAKAGDPSRRSSDVIFAIVDWMPRLRGA
jgi:hypothetical protein